MRHIRAGLLACGILCSLGAPVGAQEQQEPGQPPSSEEQEPEPPAPEEEAEPRWHFAEEETSLANLLDFNALARQIPIDYERSKMEAERVRVQPAIGLTSEEMWRLVNRALAARSLAIIQAPAADSLSVVPIGQAASLARLEPEGLASAKAGYVRVLVPLEHREIEGVAEAVRLVLSKEGGNVAVMPESNAVLVSDLTWHVEQALQLLRVLDSPAEEPVVLELPLERASPVALVALLDRILAARKQVQPGSELTGKLQAIPEAGTVLVVAPAGELDSWRELVERFDREEPILTEHYSPRRFGLGETAALIEQVVRVPDSTERAGSWRMVEDHLTGTLIITATPSRHREIAQLIARLESTGPGARRPMRTFPIRHRQVSDVVEVLRQLLEAGAIETPTQTAARREELPQGATAPIPQPIRPVRQGSDGGEVVLTADDATNRIVAVGEAALLDQLGPLIETIDVRGSQVLVEAMVVTMNENDSRSLGVELRKIGVSDGVLYELSSLFDLGAAGAGADELPELMGRGFSAAVLDPGSFSAVVNALQTISEGRSLDMPKVLVNNGEEAKLDSVVESPYLTTTSNNTAATTAFGGSLDAGTSVSVKPQVAHGDELVLAYTVSVSAFLAPPSSPALPPPRQQNSLSSVVTVPDGYTVVVGGLELESESESATQVPVLGDIPLLGALFRSQTTTRSKDKFYVFLRCSILRARAFEDLRYLSDQALPDAGLADGWPRIEPRVIR